MSRFEWRFPIVAILRQSPNVAGLLALGEVVAMTLSECLEPHGQLLPLPPLPLLSLLLLPGLETRLLPDPLVLLLTGVLPLLERGTRREEMRRTDRPCLCE